MAAMQEGIEELSRERTDLEAKVQPLVKMQAEQLELLQKTNRMSAELLETFHNAFLAAAAGDDKGLRLLVDGVAKRNRGE